MQELQLGGCGHLGKEGPSGPRAAVHCMGFSGQRGYQEESFQGLRQQSQALCSADVHSLAHSPLMSDPCLACRLQCTHVGGTPSTYLCALGGPYPLLSASLAQNVNSWWAGPCHRMQLCVHVSSTSTVGPGWWQLPNT